MVSLRHVIQNPRGMHAQPAAKIAMFALRQKASCTLVCGEQTARADQLMELMALPAKCGDTLTVSCEGEDEQKALDGLQNILEEFL